MTIILIPPCGLDGTGELDARAHFELPVDAAQMGFDGPWAEEELLGDLAVRVSSGDELCDLALAAPIASSIASRSRILPTSAWRAASSTALILSHGVPVR